MPELDLLTRYPKPKRNIEARGKKQEADIKIARQFGREFFDGLRTQGYGGYRYDGRWVSVVKDFIDHYSLTNKSSVLDVGCAKGFMLHDFLHWLPSLTVRGIDISEYAIENSIESVRPYVRTGNAKDLSIYDDHSFDLIISINTVHNLPLAECKEAIREIERVKKKYAYITVDAYRNDEERERMTMWNLTAQTILSVDDWKQMFKEIGYTGDYYWFIP